MLNRGGSLVLSVVLVAGFFLAATMQPVHAYIELGSVSFVLQVVVASAFSALFALKMFWRRIFERISRIFGSIKKDDLR